MNTWQIARRGEPQATHPCLLPRLSDELAIDEVAMKIYIVQELEHKDRDRAFLNLSTAQRELKRLIYEDNEKIETTTKNQEGSLYPHIPTPRTYHLRELEVSEE